jgi:3-oxoacyl-[acyl-carrier protein] reductase
MQLTLDNQVVVITGADRGIGQAIMTHLGQMGAVVIGTGLTEQDAESIKTHLQNNQLAGTGVVLDVCDKTENINSVVKKIKEDFDVPTILVNNAGITKDNLLMRMKDDQWHDVINTNLNGIFRMMKACIRGMIKVRKGRIVSIGSVVGVRGNTGQSNYAAAKAGLVGLTKSLARETAPYGITVNVVAPGFIDTAMTRKLTEDQREKLYKMIPLKRLGQPEDIARTTAFLCSDAASYITGETINVNGGMYMC